MGGPDSVVLVVLATALCYVNVLFVTQCYVLIVLNVILGCLTLLLRVTLC